MTLPTVSSFHPLPRPLTREGRPRRVGVEIEFGGLTEREAAEVARAELGGAVETAGNFALKLKDSALGDLGIELDTALTKYNGGGLVEAGLEAARAVVPVEIVAPPLDLDGLDRLDLLRARLRDAGATGTQDGMLLGFGVHFNVETVSPEDPFTQATIVAFGLAEDFLRLRSHIDPTRRVLPFVDPWPRTFLDAITVSGPETDFARIRALYAEHVDSRNHALDLLPLYKDADATAFAELFPHQAGIKGRPAYHFRLPDSRVDEKDWSLACEWETWRAVESLADDTEKLAALCADYRKWREDGGASRRNWADRSAAFLA